MPMATQATLRCSRSSLVCMAHGMNVTADAFCNGVAWAVIAPIILEAGNSFYEISMIMLNIFPNKKTYDMMVHIYTIGKTEVAMLCA